MKQHCKNLAKVLCGHSTKIAFSENVMLDLYETPEEMAEALIAEIHERGAYPFVRLNSPRISRALAMRASEERLKRAAEMDMFQIQKMDAYIAIRGAQNIYENSDVPHEKMAMISAAMKESVDWRVNKTKWVVLRWPTASMAQLAKMSTEAFEDFYFEVCTMDYSRMTEGMEALKNLMDKTEEVHIKGEGTDLKFSIKGMKAITCGGQYNIPDGEVFTAPVLDSVQGVVQYNAPTIYNGVSFDSIRLEFKEGVIVNASAPANTEKLREILSSDEGASRIGEFALGFNPYITKPMCDILFDEKIAGSFHFTPGQAYSEADNGNKSRIHWDMVCIQTPEYGGGEIYFDSKLIRKDGLFVGDSELEKLNPDYLKA